MNNNPFHLNTDIKKIKDSQVDYNSWELCKEKTLLSLVARKFV